MVSPAVLVFHFYRFPQVPLCLWVRSGGGYGRQGTDIRGTFPRFIAKNGFWGLTDVASLFLGNIAHSTHSVSYTLMYASLTSRRLAQLYVGLELSSTVGHPRRAINTRTKRDREQC